jgi:hypothetical protein
MPKAKKVAPNKGGRPTKYTPAMQKKADGYLATTGNDFWDYEKTIGEKSNTYERKVKITLPSIEGLAKYLGVNRSTMYEWKENYTTFSNTLEEIMAEQKRMVLEHGLNGDYNPMIAKLILAANHKMTDRTDVTSDNKPIQNNSIAFVTMKPDGADSK